MQTHKVELQAGSTKMQVRTYVNVASQAEEVKEEGKATDKINLDPPPLPKQSKKSPGVTSIPKPTHTMNTNCSLARAFMIHRVACYGP